MSLIASPHHDLCGMLEQLGFTVLETNDPADAAARADLVVVPWVNRPLSGLEWCRRVREQQPELPMLVVTRSDAEASAALEAGPRTCSACRFTTPSPAPAAGPCSRR